MKYQVFEFDYSDPWAVAHPKEYWVGLTREETELHPRGMFKDEDDAHLWAATLNAPSCIGKIQIKKAE